MTFIQVTLSDSDIGISGVGLRNDAIFQSMLKLGSGHLISLNTTRPKKRFLTQSHPTVSCIQNNELNWLLQEIDKIQPNFIIFEGVPLLEAANAVRSAFPTTKLIADFHNVEGNLFENVQVERLPGLLRPLGKFIFARQIARAKSADIEFIETVDQIWVCASEDAVLLSNLKVSKPVHIIANPIPSWCNRQMPLPQRSGKEVIFIGHLGYKPNKIAVKELSNSIMPVLQKKIPNVKLHVAGRSPGRTISKRLKTAGWQLTANPAELQSIYAHAAVTAIPLHTGGGTRIKVIEALAVGLPIVATAKAVEGLGLENGIHYLAAETKNEFVASLERLLSNKELALKLAKNGQDYVFNRFGAQAQFTAVKGAIDALI